ncbi:MAG: hypothetical protein KGM49_00695 [Sphingomonadales bacterium]|nr:hypothetical protein [Sphingomonadales bacterium]
MTTVPPVNQRGSAPAVFTPDFHEDDENERGVRPGLFHYYTAYADEGHAKAGILFGCPCGCGSLFHIGFDTHEAKSPRWHWDGNVETPSCTPSILIYQMNDKGERIGEHWHGFLTAGEFRSC